MMQNWANAILGLVLIVIAFMGLSAVTLTWTLVIIGAAVALLGVWGAMGAPTHESRSAVR